MTALLPTFPLHLTLPYLTRLLIVELGMAGVVDAAAGADVKRAAGTLTLTLEGFFMALLTYVSLPIIENNRLDDDARRHGTATSDKSDMMTATSSWGEQPEEKNDSAGFFGAETGEKEGLDGVKRAGGVESPANGVVGDASSNGPVPLIHLVAHDFMTQTSRALVRLLMSSSITASIREEAAAGARTI